MPTPRRIDAIKIVTRGLPAPSHRLAANMLSSDRTLLPLTTYNPLAIETTCQRQLMHTYPLRCTPSSYSTFGPLQSIRLQPTPLSQPYYTLHPTLPIQTRRTEQVRLQHKQRCYQYPI